MKCLKCGVDIDKGLPWCAECYKDDVLAVRDQRWEFIGAKNKQVSTDWNAELAKLPRSND